MCRCSIGLFLMIFILYSSDFSFTKDITIFNQIFTSQNDKAKTLMEDPAKSMIPVENLDKVKTLIEDPDKCMTPVENLDTPKTLMQDTNMPMTAMEALDKVQVLYASNFIKIPFKEGLEEYYYKLDQADYYLVYEGIEGDNYLFHLYEFVLDEPETGLGHTVTYGWYTVEIRTGEMISVFES